MLTPGPGCSTTWVEPLMPIGRPTDWSFVPPACGQDDVRSVPPAALASQVASPKLRVNTVSASVALSPYRHCAHHGVGRSHGKHALALALALAQ